MFATAMSNSTLSEEASSVCSLNPMVQFQQTQNTNTPQQPTKVKRKRNLPGNPDPEAEVIALSPKSLLATNRFVCEICKKGFQRDQNLQLHRRGHNLPWKLKQRNSKELGMIKKKVYVCPEPTCVHHNPTRALGDLTGIKKHFCRKHGERKFKCEKCSKIYAVFSDWKAHSKTCGTREYRCDCGTLFSRKDSFITHRAFCDALAEESAKVLSSNPLLMNSPLFPLPTTPPNHHPRHQFPSMNISLSPNNSPLLGENNKNITAPQNQTNNYPNIQIKPEDFSSFFQPPLEASPFAALHVSMQPATSSANLSATALLQKAATMGHVTSGMTGMLGFGAGLGPLMGHMGLADMTAGVVHHPPTTSSSQDQQMGATWDHQKSEDYLTRDFLGLAGAHHQYGGGSGGGGFDILEYGAAAASVPTGFGYVAEAEARAAGSDTWGPC